MDRFVPVQIAALFLITLEMANGMFLSGKIMHPFKKFSSSLVIHQMNLKCEKRFSSMKLCAEHGNSLNNTHVGFLLDTKTKSCKICQPLTFSEIGHVRSLKNVNNLQNKVLYLLRQKKKSADLYFPMEPITDPAFSVVTHGIHFHSGKVDQGLYVSPRGDFRLQGLKDNVSAPQQPVKRG